MNFKYFMFSFFLWGDKIFNGTHYSTAIKTNLIPNHTDLNLSKTHFTDEVSQNLIIKKILQHSGLFFVKTSTTSKTLSLPQDWGTCGKITF